MKTSRLTMIAMILVLCSVLISGCAGWKTKVSEFNKPTRPAGCEQSLFYDYMPAPQLEGTVELIGISILVKNYPASKPFILKFATSMLKSLDDDQLTYLDFVTIANDNVKWINKYFGAPLVQFQPFMVPFDRPIPIYQCDRDILKKRFTELAAIVQ